MGGVVPTLVQCEDRDKAHVGPRDIEGIAKFQLVATCDAQFDVADSDSIDSRPPQPFHGVMRNAFEGLEVRHFRGNVASHASVEDEQEVSGV